MRGTNAASEHLAGNHLTIVPATKDIGRMYTAAHPGERWSWHLCLRQSRRC